MQQYGLLVVKEEGWRVTDTQGAGTFELDRRYVVTGEGDEGMWDLEFVSEIYQKGEITLMIGERERWI